VLEEMTGAPTQGFWISNFSREEIFTYYKSIEKYDFIKLALTNSELTNDLFNFLPHHCYPIVDVLTIQ